MLTINALRPESELNGLMEAKKDLEEKVRRLRLQFERNQQELQRYKEAGAEELKKLKSEN